MPYRGPYDCTICGASSGRENLTVVSVQFKPMGPGTRVIKSRTTQWLCSTCLDKDPVWNLPQRVAPAYQL